MKPIIYVAHPVSGSPFDNAQRAIQWVRWFAIADDTRIYSAPWVAEVLGFIGETMPHDFYQRVVDDDCEVIARMDGIVGVGGSWSIGMLQERATAKALGHDVLDMTLYSEPAEVPGTLSMALSWEAGMPRYHGGA